MAFAQQQTKISSAIFHAKQLGCLHTYKRQQLSVFLLTKMVINLLTFRKKKSCHLLTFKDPMSPTTDRYIPYFFDYKT